MKAQCGQERIADHDLFITDDGEDAILIPVLRCPEHEDDAVVDADILDVISALEAVKPSA
jgi:hypothetical protein